MTSSPVSWRRRFQQSVRRLAWHVRRYLSWNRVYRTTSYLRSALWVVPLFSIVLVMLTAPALLWIDSRLQWRLSGLETAGAHTLFDTLITLSLSFMVFTFGSLLVAIQVASGQMTPRIIATTLLRDNVVRYSVGLFVFALIFGVMARNRLQDKVPHIVALVAITLGFSCIAMFLFLIDYAARLLRPGSILARVADEGVQVIQAVYPADADLEGDGAGTTLEPPVGPRRTVLHSGGSGIVLAIDRATVVREARWSDGIVELVPQVGDFVSNEEPLFVLYGGATAIDDRSLEEAVAFGPERTMEQDPLFSFRIVVDIALKALSPAINDPTTAVLAIDQVHRLLRQAGRRRLRDESILDARGQLRLIRRTPNWEDFVHLACTEIRACGAGNVQVARRLRSMFESLLAALPAHRHAAIVEEKRRLDRVIEKLYDIPEDLALARIPDSQGLGSGAGNR